MENTGAVVPRLVLHHGVPLRAANPLSRDRGGEIERKRKS
jgi:hypothetical protein